MRAARLCAADGLRLGVNRLNLRARRGRASVATRARFIRARRAPRLVAGEVSSGRRGRVVAYRRAAPRVEAVATIRRRRIPLRYVDTDRAVTRARLSASSGLRHGRSTVRVRAVAPAGRVGFLSRTITVPASAPIAGAGANQRIRVGQDIVLDGSDSIPSLGGARSLEYSWDVVAAPAGLRSGIAAPGAERTVLRADRPGRYEVRLTVTDPATRSRSRDTLIATVTPQPLAPISTLSSANGAPGVSLLTSRFCAAGGPGCFFANAGGSGTLQLVVLERDTLTLYDPTGASDPCATPTATTCWNRSYPLTQDGMDQLNVDLSQIAPDTSSEADTGLLAIVTLDSGTIADVSDFSAAIARIGAQPFASSTASVSGPFSIVGVPDMIAGKAWTNYGHALDGGTPGSLDGYIKESAYYTQGSILEADQRVFSYRDVRSFDTRVGSGPVAVQIGTYDPATTAFTQATVASFPNGAGGLGIATFDALTLAPKTSAVYARQSSTAGLDWSSIQSVLAAAARSGDGVVITSLGQFGDFATEPDASSFGGVLNALAALGGQPDIFARAANTTGATYSFISSANVGAEASSVILAGVAAPGLDNPIADGGLTGALQRGPDGRYIVVKGDPAGLYDPTLAAVLAQDPIDWPDTPSASRHRDERRRARPGVAGELRGDLRRRHPAATAALDQPHAVLQRRRRAEHAHHCDRHPGCSRCARSRSRCAPTTASPALRPATTPATPPRSRTATRSSPSPTSRPP